MPTLKLTDGTTTINFGDMAGNYPLLSGGYVPKINALRVGSIGGRGPYEEVEETITFDIVDTTAAACYTRLNTLAGLLLQANRFARGEFVSPVLLQYSPDGASVSSSGTPLQALVVGSPSGTPSGVSLPVTFDTTGFKYRIENVEISIVRQVWLFSTETQTSASVDNGTVTTVTFSADAEYFSPTKAYFLTMMGYNLVPGFYVVGSGSNSIQAVSVANTTGSPSGAGYTYVNDSANLPRNGSHVLRYTPTGTTEAAGYCYNKIDLEEGKRYAVLVSCKNNSGSTSFGVRAGIKYYGHTYISQHTEQRTIAAGSIAGYVSLGTFVAVQDGSPYGSPATDVALEVTASAASGSIDFDSLIIVEADNASIIQISNPFKLGTSLATHSEYVTFDNRYLTGIDARPWSGAVSGESYEIVCAGGEVLSKGTTIKIVLLATNSTYWKIYAAITLASTHQLTRQRVYLSPV